MSSAAFLNLGQQWHPTFDSVTDGICLLDASGHVLRVNDPLLRLLQRPEEEVVGRRPDELLAEALDFLDVGGLVPSLAAGSHRQVAEVQAGDRWYALSLDVIKSAPQAEPDGGILVIADCTDRKRTRDLRRIADRRESEATELRHDASRMRELERMKSDFLNLASHELRGPLSVLRGYISMLEDGSLGSLTDSMRDVVPVMTAKLREMNVLINQMLETARLEDSRLVLSRERLDLRDVIGNALEAMRPIASRNHEVLVDPGTSQVLVNGDRSRLTTILTNLIDNAIKYSPEGGEVRCRLRVRDDQAMLSVADCGLGIDEKDLPRLFTRFGRLVNVENSHIPGTGLGLYLSRELARMHGGEVGVESKAGVGSTFTLRLPIAATAAEG